MTISRKQLKHLRRDPQALTRLVSQAIEGDAEERERAVQTLETLRHVKVPLPLDRLFDSAEARLRRVAVQLESSDDEGNILRRAVYDEDDTVRQAAFRRSSGLLSDIAFAQDLLTSHRPELRREALEAMWWGLPAELSSTVQGLLDDEDPATRGRAAVLLAETNPQIEGLLQPLLMRVEQTEGFDRQSAVQLLAQVLAAQPSRVAERHLFVDLITATDAELRAAALEASAVLAPDHDDVARPVLEALGDPEAGRFAAESLGRRGDATIRLVPDLLTLAKTATSKTLRNRALLALSRLGETDHIDQLRELLREAAGEVDPKGECDPVTGFPAHLGALALECIRVLGTRASTLGPDLITFARTCADRAVVVDACELFPIVELGIDAEEVVAEIYAKSPASDRERLARVAASLGARTDAGLRLFLKESASAARRWRDLDVVLSAMARLNEELPSRIEAVGAGDATLTPNAACAREALGVVDERTLDLLLHDLLEGSDEARERAIGRIRVLGERAAPLLPRVLDALSTADTPARVACLEVIAPLAVSAAGEALRAITGAMESQVDEVAAAARMAMIEIDDPDQRHDEPTGNLAVDSIRHLAGSVLPLLSAASDNTVFSPLSLFSATVLLLRGSRGETLQQLASLLGFQAESQSTIWSDAAALRRQLHVDDDGFTLADVAAVFSQEGYPILKDFLQDVAAAGVVHKRVDFAHRPALARDAVNLWVSEATRERIRDLVSEFDPLTRFAIVSATYLLAKWEQPFSDQTRPGSFNLLDGTRIDVPLMFRQGGFRYARGPRLDLVELPYRNGIADLFVIAPDLGFFRHVHHTFGMHTIEDLEPALEEGFDNLRMPRFKFGRRMRLTDPLADLGFTLLRSGDVDLSAMLTTKEPLPGTVLQEAVIDVNETGTEAAAATVIAHVGGVPLEIVVDRPFLFVLRHRLTKAPLFVGSVLDPRGS